MRCVLLTAEGSYGDRTAICDVVNRLQLFFSLTQHPDQIKLPGRDRGGAPLLAADLYKFVASSCAAIGIEPGTKVLLYTSRQVSPVIATTDDIAIISDHHRNDTPNASVVWAAQKILQLGLSWFVEHKCDKPSCICHAGKEFLAICEQCEADLRKSGYRDGITHLKDAINWLNQRRDSANPDTNLRPLVDPQTNLVLANHFASKLSAEDRYPFRGKVILMVLHFLSDLIPFVEALQKLGALPSEMYLIAKPYPYSRRDLVSHILECKGVHVYRATPGKYVDVWAKEVLNEVNKSTSIATKPIVVIEDGGYFAPILHSAEFSALLSRCIGIVEQTTKGIKHDRELIGETPKVPVLSVAESKFKTEYESPEIGRITIQNISRFVPNTKLSGRNAVLFGFGAVGEHVAAQLNRAFNMAVSVVDIDAAKLLKAKHRKDVVVECATKFTELRFRDQIRLAVGTTGAPNGKASINEEVLSALPDGCILVSTSSDRIEIDINALEKMSHGKRRDIEEGKTEYTISVGGAEKKIVLLADGYPINFYGSESLPNDTIDPVMTLLILCAIYICEHNDLPVKFHTELVNKVTDEFKLIEEFLPRC